MGGRKHTPLDPREDSDRSCTDHCELRPKDDGAETVSRWPKSLLIQRVSIDAKQTNRYIIIINDAIRHLFAFKCGIQSSSKQKL
jgi:hypothetical protein